MLVNVHHTILHVILVVKTFDSFPDERSKLTLKANLDSNKTYMAPINMTVKVHFKFVEGFLITYEASLSIETSSTGH